MFPELLESVAVKLDAAGIPYMVICGQAVLLYGEPRLTRDIDITLGIGASEVGRVLTLSREIGLAILARDPEAFVRQTMVLPTRDNASGLRVDFIFFFSSYERQAIERAVTRRLKTTDVRFAGVEDVVIHKLVAGRPRDLEDVRTILVRQPECDESYLTKWLGEFDRALASNCLGLLETIRRQTVRD